jgi:hypothetical protein
MLCMHECPRDKSLDDYMGEALKDPAEAAPTSSP